MIKFFCVTFILVLNLFFDAAQSQPIFRLHINAQIELGSIMGGGNAIPFWIKSNQYGVPPMSSPAGVLQGRLWRDYKPVDSLTKKEKRFDYSFAVNPVVTYDRENGNEFLLPEAHFKLRYRQIELKIGRFRELMGIGDSTLSSGFFIESGNAIPLPKLTIATKGYVPLAFTRNFVAINTGIAHGQIQDPPYIKNARLHQKYIYFKVGKMDSPIKLLFGINHQVMWAGHSEYLKQQPDLALNGQLPSSWSFFPNVVFAYTPKDWSTKKGYTYFDSYRVGNHLGTYDMGIEARVRDKEILFYYQHIYEDVSSFVFKNATDGLWGISYAPVRGKNNRGLIALSKLTTEFLTTMNQSGLTFFVPGSTYQGHDNYFNHSQYIEGWSYLGRTIGTPFIIPGESISGISNPSAYFPNNRMRTWYIGSQWVSKRNCTIITRTSFSQNFGLARLILAKPLNQFSGLVSVRFPIKRWSNTSMIINLAGDSGKLLPGTLAISGSIQKTW